MILILQPRVNSNKPDCKYLLMSCQAPYRLLTFALNLNLESQCMIDFAQLLLTHDDLVFCSLFALLTQ